MKNKINKVKIIRFKEEKDISEYIKNNKGSTIKYLVYYTGELNE